MKKFNIGDQLEIIGTCVKGVVCMHSFTSFGTGSVFSKDFKPHGDDLAFETDGQFMLLSSLDISKLKKV